MIPGRKPKPYGLKVLEGTAPRRRVTPLRRKLSGLCGRERADGLSCRLIAGWGTEQKGVGPCKHHLDSPEIATQLPEPPSYLPPHARELWKELAPRLYATGRLLPEDVPAFTILCQAHHFQLHAAVLLMKEGLTVEDKVYKRVVKGEDGEATVLKGMIRKHPAWQMWRDSANVVRQYDTEFGITPSSRTRLEILETPDDEDDPWQSM